MACYFLFSGTFWLQCVHNLFSLINLLFFFVQITYKHQLVSCLGHRAGGGVTVAPVAEDVVAVCVHPGRECEKHTKA